MELGSGPDEVFRLRRRSAEPWPVDPDRLECLGWSPEGTATGDPRVGVPLTADPFDSRPARTPYPKRMPSLADVAKTGPVDLDVHARAKRARDRAVHEGLVLAAAGRPPAGLARAILDRQALRQEMGTGVVELTVAERRALGSGRGGDMTGRGVE